MNTFPDLPPLPNLIAGILLILVLIFLITRFFGCIAAAAHWILHILLILLVIGALIALYYWIFGKTSQGTYIDLRLLAGMFFGMVA
jgi:glucan phosphoethanolaminetransferase (alkaline phosphatase superfamily)